MSIVWLDTSVAAAGDMLLSALIDAGASEHDVRSGLAALGLPDWTLTASKVMRGAFHATRCEVSTGDGPSDPHAGPPDAHHHMPDPAHDHHPDHSHSHDHGHDHDHDHGHDHDHDHGHGHSHDHGHRPWRDVRALIEAAALPERARERALRAYLRLAEAEAKLHGEPVDDVMLHEVGSTDAIIDIVGVCLALESLDAERIVATPLPMGTGRVAGAHGTMPLPAPATLEVLRGWPVVPSPWPGEWVTPTGAALIAALCEPGPMPAMTLQAIGYGAGKRNPGQVANVVRAIVGQPTGAHDQHDVIELSANLDDTPGEWIPPLFDRLLAAGALDVWATPSTTKKGRPGLVVQVLARPHHETRLSTLLLLHSTTLGVRSSRMSRQVLERRVDRVQTAYGEVRVKVALQDGVALRGAPEHEDVLAAALAAEVPVSTVYTAALTAWSTR